jgi:Family of unknown function (DUF6088)
MGLYTQTVCTPRHPCCCRPGLVSASAGWPDSSSGSGCLRVPEDAPQNRRPLPLSRGRCQGHGRENGEPNQRLRGKSCQSTWAFNPSQVPVQNVFWTEGPSRTVRIGNQTVALRHVAPSKMIGAGTEAGIVVQAIRSLGKEGIHGISLHSLAERLPPPVKRAVQRLVPAAPAWSQPVLNQISA